MLKKLIITSVEVRCFSDPELTSCGSVQYSIRQGNVSFVDQIILHATAQSCVWFKSAF